MPRRPAAKQPASYGVTKHPTKRKYYVSRTSGDKSHPCSGGFKTKREATEHLGTHPKYGSKK